MGSVPLVLALDCTVARTTHPPWRSIGKPDRSLPPKSIAASESDPDDDVRGSREYQKRLIRMLCARAPELALEDAAGNLDVHSRRLSS